MHHVQRPNFGRRKKQTQSCLAAIAPTSSTVSNGALESRRSGTLGGCPMGTTLSALVLSSSTKQLRTRYERSLNSAIESGQFTLLGGRGQKASSSALFEHLEASLRQVDAPRRNA